MLVWIEFLLLTGQFTKETFIDMVTKSWCNADLKPQSKSGKWGRRGRNQQLNKAGTILANMKKCQADPSLNAFAPGEQYVYLMLFSDCKE